MRIPGNAKFAQPLAVSHFSDSTRSPGVKKFEGRRALGYFWIIPRVEPLQGIGAREMPQFGPDASSSSTPFGHLVTPGLSLT